jgi:hypothetical protein
VYNKLVKGYLYCKYTMFNNVEQQMQGKNIANTTVYMHGVAPVVFHDKPW